MPASNCQKLLGEQYGMSLIELGLLGFEPMTHALVKSTIKIGKDPACSIAGFHVLFITDSAQLTNAINFEYLLTQPSPVSFFRYCS